MDEGHALYERMLACVFWSAFLLEPMYGCMLFMHVDTCSSWESNLKLDPAGRLARRWCWGGGDPPSAPN